MKNEYEAFNTLDQIQIGPERLGLSFPLKGRLSCDGVCQGPDLRCETTKAGKRRRSQ